MKLITELKLPIEHTKQSLIFEVAKRAKISPNLIKKFEIIKMGIDARKKPKIFFVYNVAIEVDKGIEHKLKNFEDITPDHSGLNYKKVSSNCQPVIVGFGPSGMFCALSLALAGLHPIILEQGKDVEARQKDVENFWHNRV